MNGNEFFPEQNISTIIPILIGYPAIQELLSAKFKDEIINKEDANGRQSNYARILDVSLDKSNIEEYDLLVGINLETLTFLYRNKEILVNVHVSLILDVETQKIGIEKFKIDSKGKSWLADQLLESVVNNFMYDKIKEKLNFDFMPQIQDQVTTLNDKLANRLEAREGIHITGSLEKLEIILVESRDTALWIFLKIIGFGVVEIEKLEM
ncbi:protein of unknown function [Flavobacteriaceae bacterium MAR_2010_188]|nr:protein of unknown function [Flavobacteriaceae bacterium MAR_2010_188]